jgi:hypothetical protein
MNMKKNSAIRKAAGWIVRAGLISVCLSGFPARAEMRVVKPDRDVMKIKVGGMDISLLNTVVDTNSAHALGVISFFFPRSEGPGEQLAFEISGEYKPNLTLQSGADCAISGVRVLRDEHKLRVVYAARKGGWFDKKAVDLTIFELTENNDGMPGTPGWYFKQIKVVHTRSSYCDVYSALEQEPSLYQ